MSQLAPPHGVETDRVDSCPEVLSYLTNTIIASIVAIDKLKREQVPEPHVMFGSGAWR